MVNVLAQAVAWEGHFSVAEGGKFAKWCRCPSAPTPEKCQEEEAEEMTDVLIYSKDGTQDRVHWQARPRRLELALQPPSPARPRGLAIGSG